MRCEQARLEPQAEMSMAFSGYCKEVGLLEEMGDTVGRIWQVQ